MTTLFLKIINMSISATWLALIVILLRLILRKSPKWFHVLLWGMVGIRLVCPFSLESALSLSPKAETIRPEIMMDREPAIDSGITSLNNMVNPIISQVFTPEPWASANPLQIWIPVGGNLWLLGIIVMLIYTAVSYWLLRRKVATAIPLQDNIFQSEHISSPFVLGIIKPRIYLPFHLRELDIAHVIAHEQAHIRRKDHWWKPLGFLLLTLHWFNPILWVAYVLLCRDIELACDEKAIGEMGIEQRADYSQALLSCSVNRKIIAACPLAFGEVHVKERVKSVLNYKKPAFWIVLISSVSCLVVGICFLTNPKEAESVYTGKVLRIESRKRPDFLIYSSFPVALEDPVIDYYPIENMENIKLPGDYTIHFSIDKITNKYLEISFDTQLVNSENTITRIELTSEETKRLLTSEIGEAMYYTFSIIDDEDSMMSLTLDEITYLAANNFHTEMIPEGYEYAGTLTSEQANGSTYEGHSYYKSPLDPNNLYVAPFYGIGNFTNNIPMTHGIRWVNSDLSDSPEFLEISKLLTVICSSPNGSSHPQDYISTHPTEYHMLVNDLTEYTLRYLFEQFNLGHEINYVMAQICNDICIKLGEDTCINEPLSYSNGQQWFRHFAAYAWDNKRPLGKDKVSTHYPVTWIFLQVIEGVPYTEEAYHSSVSYNNIKHHYEPLPAKRGEFGTD